MPTDRRGRRTTRRGPAFRRRWRLPARWGSGSVYTYRIPQALIDTIRPGMLVEVPFGPRVMAGIVLSLNSRVEPGIRLRDVVGLLDPLPCLTPSQIGLAEWIAEYYSCRVNDAIALMVPAGIGRAPVVLYSLPTEPPPARQVLDRFATRPTGKSWSASVRPRRLASPVNATPRA